MIDDNSDSASCSLMAFGVAWPAVGLHVSLPGAIGNLP
jgi:hypothetical protein